MSMLVIFGAGFQGGKNEKCLVSEIVIDVTGGTWLVLLWMVKISAWCVFARHMQVYEWKAPNTAMIQYGAQMMTVQNMPHFTCIVHFARALNSTSILWYFGHIIV